MGTQFRMDCVPGSLIVVGGGIEPWLTVLENAGWRCMQCTDLRKADQLFTETGPCIGIVDLSHDEFSLHGVANLVSSHKQVRWIAFIREAQLSSDTTCQFIVNFCIDFFTSPIPDAKLLSTIGHQLGMLQLEKKVWPNYGVSNQMNLLGDSPSIQRIREQIQRIAPTDVSILISGENGVGKERVARAIHDYSARCHKPFVSINCRAMSEKQLEIELFGIGCSDPIPPLLAKAHQGTLLLNDILALPERQQLNLLHFFQRSMVSAHHQPTADVRILATHSTDIEKALIDGNFNEELYHYINVLRIHVPSLRERAMDIRLLAKHFLKEYAKEYNAQARSFSQPALEIMEQYDWPGNIRQLMNQIKRMVLMSDSVMLDDQHLELPKRDLKRTLKTIKEDCEREALQKALESHRGQISNAAKELGISRATMYRLLNKHNLLNDSIL